MTASVSSVRRPETSQYRGVFGLARAARNQHRAGDHTSRDTKATRGNRRPPGCTSRHRRVSPPDRPGSRRQGRPEVPRYVESSAALTPAILESKARPVVLLAPASRGRRVSESARRISAPRTAKTCSLSALAHCETVALAPRMLVRRRMQVWPVGAPTGPSRLHAYTGSEDSVTASVSRR
jgi:hypothetical protein